jgi:photosystem II stability/assembly factor-like uncharacterized protein
MNKILLFLIAIIISNSTLNIDICKSQWVWQYTASQYSLLTTIQFPTENIGYTVGFKPQTPRSVFLKTTNGGNNWNDMNIVLTFPTELIDMIFANENTGYICGRSVDIYKTTNGGINWLTIQVPYFGNQTWNSIQFLDTNIGFIAGRYGMHSKTTNGGVNWSSTDTTWSDINAIYFLNETTGFMAEVSSTVQKTTNGGTNWTTTLLMDTNSVYYSLNKIEFTNNTGYIIGSNTVNGAVFKTTDNGNTWKNILITPSGLYSIKVVNHTTLYVGNKHNIVYYSTNAGLTWSDQTVPTTKGEIFSIYFTNNITGYLTVGNEIYKTTNGGVGISNISSEIPNEFRLFQNYPNPFNSSTKIRFQIIKKDRVKILFYDIKGAEISPTDGLVNDYLAPGVYEYLFNSDNLSSGIYFCKVVTNNYSETIKLMIIK